MSAPLRHVLSLSDRDTIAAFRRKLADADFTPDGLRKALGLKIDQAIPITELPLVLRGLPPGPLSTLIRLFDFGLPIDPEVLARDLSPLQPRQLVEAGLITLGPEGAVAQVRIKPFGDCVFASDRRYPDPTSMPSNLVLEVNPTSEDLAYCTPRRRVGSTLDVGSGCGVLSVLAAAHSDKVVGTDINPRALNFTAFNALLNGRDNIECLEGSLLAPVAGRTFDLILSNPPFVISPDSGMQFRDSGWRGDTFSRELVRLVPGRLKEGGIAVVQCNWALKKGEDWTAPLTEWIAGSGCDAVLFRVYTETALDYAGLWNQALAVPQPQAYEAAIDRWTRYYGTLGIETIVGGRIVLRRRTAAENWAFTIDGEHERTPGGGDHLVRIIEAQDWLNGGIGPGDFLKAAFRPAENFRLDQTFAFREDRLAPVQSAVRLDDGFIFRAPADPLTCRVLSMCDGRRTMGEVAESIGRETGSASKELQSRIVGGVRNLYGLGFLTRA